MASVGNQTEKKIIPWSQCPETIHIKHFIAAYMKIALSLIKSSTAERFPNTMFMMRKKNAPLLINERDKKKLNTDTSLQHDGLLFIQLNV